MSPMVSSSAAADVGDCCMAPPLKALSVEADMAAHGGC